MSTFDNSLSRKVVIVWAALGVIVVCLAFASSAKKVAPPSSGQTVRMKVTAYCVCERCCKTWALRQRQGGRVTAIGDDASICDGVSADFTLLPPRTKLMIPGAGEKEVDDTGSAMRAAARKGDYHIELRCKTHTQAKNWGVQYCDVFVLK